VNVSVDNLAPCKKLLRVEQDMETVNAAFEEVTRDFQRHVQLPGFRPGKAPRHLVLKAFAGEIETRVKRKLIGEAYRQAVKDQKLDVVGAPEIEEIQFGKGQVLQFAATIETVPEFELPEYKGLPVRREVRAVTEEDIARAIDILRNQRATFVDLTRPVESGDYVVVNYRGTCEGKPITETAPTARGLTEKENFWLHIEPSAFIPGFTDQLIGARAGEKRTVTVTFPADFVSAPLAGRSGEYEVEIVQVKEKQLPEPNDAFAALYEAGTFEALREGVRRDLENELNYKIKRETRDQLVRELLSRVTFDLPESVVLRETRNVVYDIVRDNQQRGVSRETIDQQRDQIFSVANNSARERVRVSFILAKIAEKEGVHADSKEVSQRIVWLAGQHNMPPEKLLRQLHERNGIAELQDQIISGKVLDLLEHHARIEQALPPGGTPA